MPGQARDRLAGALSERNQEIKRPAAKAQGFPILGQHALGGDEPERSEDEDFFIHRGIVLKALHKSYNGSGLVWRNHRSATMVRLGGLQIFSPAPGCTR